MDLESEEGVCEAEAENRLKTFLGHRWLKVLSRNIVYLIELCTSDEMREERILYLFQSSGAAAESNSCFLTVVYIPL